MKLSIVICGWHFKNKEIYKKIIEEVTRFKSCLETNNFKYNLFIASHRDENGIEPALLQNLTQLGWEVLIFENEGWDWGCYQQFLHWQEKNGGLSDYYLFLQDDIIIKSEGLLNAFWREIKKGHHVVGNSFPVQKRERVRIDYPEDLFWAELKGFKIESLEWNVVRGSCFFCTRSVAEEVLVKMPIKKGENILLANSSLRIFGGLVEDHFGSSSIGYLSRVPRESDYIYEEYRGEAGSKGNFFLQAMSFFLDHSYVVKILFRKLKNTKVMRACLGKGIKIRVSFEEDNIPGYFNVDSESRYSDYKGSIYDLNFIKGSIAEIVISNNYFNILLQKDIKIVIRWAYLHLIIGGLLIFDMKNGTTNYKNLRKVIIDFNFKDTIFEKGKFIFSREIKAIVAIK